MRQAIANNSLPEYTVTQISAKLKNIVENEFSYVRIRGEVSGFKLAPSGHAYFSLKDNNSILASVCWRNTINSLAIKPEEGMEIICVGTITIYPGQSKYQLVVEKVEHAGIGSLMAMLEKRKAEFSKEGLFSVEHKKPIPFLPKKIGIITSPTGAVIRDMLHRIKDRFPSHVILWPVLVQGEKAAAQVTEAILGFNQLDDKPDILIVARGGGSVEDLWPFNEEIVVRAAFSSKIPIISAIGHETDFTLLDFVADLRAPTPTAAAEKAVPVLANVSANLRTIMGRIEYAIEKFIEFRRAKLLLFKKSLPNYHTILLNFIQRLDDLAMRLSSSIDKYFLAKQNNVANLKARLKHPRDIVKLAEEKLNQTSIRLKRSGRLSFENNCHRLKLVTSLLESYSYKKTLARGFVIFSDENNNTITSAKLASKGDKLNAQFHDGKFSVTVD